MNWTTDRGTKVELRKNEITFDGIKFSASIIVGNVHNAKYGKNVAIITKDGQVGAVRIPRQIAKQYEVARAAEPKSPEFYEMEEAGRREAELKSIYNAYDNGTISTSEAISRRNKNLRS